MAEHKNAQVLRWIADGELQRIQYKVTMWAGWLWLHAQREQNFAALLRGEWADDWEFRLAPRTITINGREIEAPLGSVKDGEAVYASDASGASVYIKFDGNNGNHCAMLASGRLFASHEAARAAYDAITLLLAPQATE